MEMSLSSYHYTSEEFYQKERQEVFGKTWLLAGSLEDLKEPGQYIAQTLAEYPILLLRGSDEKIRGFHNFCRHRAAPLITEGKGKIHGKTIRCSYHGWCYNDKGDINYIPYAPAKTPCEDLNLVSIHVHVYKDFVFVNFWKDAPNFETTMKELIETLEQSKYPFHDFNSSRTMTRIGNFNWKVWIDGYQECYHCETVHPVLRKDFQLSRYKIENRNLFSLHQCERKVESKETGSFQGLWLWVYPNLGFPCYEQCFYTLQVIPLSVNKTKLHYHFRFASHLTETEKDDFIKFVESLTQEDFDICEKVQKNLQTGIYQHGFLNEERENGVIYFHNLVRSATEKRSELLS